MVESNTTLGPLKVKCLIDDEYSCYQTQGEGGQGTCWYAIDKNMNDVAVKVFLKETEKAKLELATEIELYKIVGEHKNLIKLLHHNPQGV